MATQDPAKIKMAELMLQGEGWQEAVEHSGVKTSRAGANAFLARYRLHGAKALEDRRRGRVSKIVGEIQLWLLETCQQAPEITSREVQAALLKQHNLRMSTSQINRLRAVLGISRPQKRQP